MVAVRAAYLGAVLLGALGCSASLWQQVPHDRLYQRVATPALHQEPEETERSDWWDAFYNESFHQFGRMVSPGYYLAQAAGGPKAVDVNAFGKVPDSPWFHNRMGKYEISAADVWTGANQRLGPAAGKLRVKKAKSTGVTPGLVVEDSAGERWVVKFDPPAYPDLASAADVISSKLLYAAGYHVAENYIAHFRPDQLVLDGKATTRDRYNRKVKLDEAGLADLISLLNPEGDGQLRAMFSRFVQGKPVGPFDFEGLRGDDPNDKIPHELRRSLRGLWVFFAWLNNTDAKPSNSLDVFLQSAKDPQLGHLRHYLIDFGTSLGSGASGMKHLGGGYEYLVDWEQISVRFLTLGIYYPYWSTLQRTPYRSVGPFESKVFDPGRWRPIYPNAAFDAADSDDTFWAASILAHFQPKHIAIAVSAGAYREPGAAEWVVQTLLKRRDKLLRHAFSKRIPLDEPKIVGNAQLVLTDLEVLSELRDISDVSYLWRVRWQRADGNDAIIDERTTEHARIDLASAVSSLIQRSARELSRSPFLTVSCWRRTRTKQGVLIPHDLELSVQLRVLADGSVVPIGLERNGG